MTSNGEVSFRDILHFVNRRGGVLIRAVLIGLGLGVIASLALPPTYRAATLVTQDEAFSGIAFENHSNGNSNTTSGATALATLAEVVKSDGVRGDALAQLTPRMGRTAARGILKTLRVKPVGESQLLRITVDSRDPGAAATAANAVATTLIGRDLAERRLRATQARATVEQELVVAIPKLRASEDAVALFQTQHKDVVLATQTTSNLAKLAQLQSELADVRLLRQEAQGRIESSRTRLSLQARIQPVQWMPSPLITTLQNQLATQEIEMAGMRRQFAPKYPPLVAAETKIEETKHRLDAELARSLQVEQYGVDPVYQQTLQQLRQDETSTAAYDARERALTSVIKDYESKFRALPADEVQQSRLIRASKQAEAAYQALSDRLLQARAAEASIGSAIHVVDFARSPEQPLRPRWLLALLGTVVGLIAGAGGTLMKERLVNPLASVEDAEQALGLPVLGSIPPVPSDDEPRPAPGEVADQAPRDPRHRFRAFRSMLKPSIGGQDRWSSFGGSFRYLRTNLLYIQKGSLRTLLVTSPGPNNESEIVAANAAVAMAHAGLRVWLVDCDLRQSPLDRGWAIDVSEAQTTGLAELLEYGTAPDQLLRPTPMENLSLLPAGMASANPSDLLASQAMREFVELDRAGVDVVVLSAPPVLSEPDAAALASMVDGVLLVVHLATTSRDAAARARQQLEAGGARVLGAVVTGASAEVLPRYGGRHAPYDTSTSWYLGPHRQGAGNGAAAAPPQES